MSLHNAGRPGTASSGQFAEIRALSSVARFHGRAVVVGATAFDAILVGTDLAERTLAIVMASDFADLDAVLQRISSEAGSAEANGLVVRRPTIGVDTADVLETARVLTPVSDAGLVEGASVVCSTRIDAEAFLTDSSQGTIGIVEAEFLGGNCAFERWVS